MLDSKKNTANFVFFGIITAGLITISFLLFKIFQNRNTFSSQSGISATVFSGTADVYLDDSKIGSTPFESSNIKPGTHTIKLTNNLTSYETSIPFTTSSKEIPQVVLNRDLGVSKVFSSGQNFWIDYKDLSSKISVVSEPSQATVFIDDTEAGKTPYSSSVLIDGEYDLKVVAPGYEPQVARVKIKNNYKLNVSVQLFLVPVSDKPSTVSGSKIVYDLSSDNNDLVLDLPSWVKGIIYWNKTRSATLKFSYYLDYLGGVYGMDGNVLAGTDSISLKAGDSVAYLGRKVDNGMTKEALGALSRFVGVDVAGGKRVKVLETGLGWLRVRSEPSLNGKEVGKLNTGDMVSVLEEKAGWMRVSLLDNTSGWVSATYVQEVKD